VIIEREGLAIYINKTAHIFRKGMATNTVTEALESYLPGNIQEP